jgi:hypothetical protein
LPIDNARVEEESLEGSSLSGTVASSGGYGGLTGLMGRVLGGGAGISSAAAAASLSSELIQYNALRWNESLFSLGVVHVLHWNVC